MKKHFFLILGISILIGLLSCERVSTKNEYCVRRILNNPDSIILSETDLNFTKSLFSANHLSINHYQFYALEKDESGCHVECRQFIKNLNVFSNELIFHFDSFGKYTSLTGYIIDEALPASRPSMHQNSVIDKFISEINKDGFYAESIEEFKSDCFDCELGYYNLNVGTGSTVSKFTRVWKVNPKDNQYPNAIINDLNGSIIYYDNGFRYK